MLPIPWSITGSAVFGQTGNVVLTRTGSFQAGAMWDPCKIDLTAPFDLSWTINFGANGECGGDGMAFVLQNDPAGVAALGDPSAAHGYCSGSGPGIINSLAVSMDTFINPGYPYDDPSYQSLGIQVGAADVDQGCSYTATVGGISGPCRPPILGNTADVTNGANHIVEFMWNPVGANATLTVVVDGGMGYAQWTVANYASLFPTGTNVYFGMTGAIGGLNEIQQAGLNLGSTVNGGQVVTLACASPVYTPNVNTSPIMTPYCQFSPATPSYTPTYSFGTATNTSTQTAVVTATLTRTPTFAGTFTASAVVTATRTTTTGPSLTPTPTNQPGAPTVTGVLPSSGPLSGGTTVTLTGTNFTGATSVTFGGVPGTSVTVINATTLQVLAPAGSAGTVNVVVSNAFGSSSAAPANQYTYQAPPTVTGLAPASGPNAGGTSVVITGTNFANLLSVTLDGLATTYVVNSPTQITATAPNHTGHGAKPVTVTVTNTGGQGSLANGYTYTPSLTSVSPAFGPVTGGNSVTLTGNGFLSATSLTINGVSTPFTAVSDTQITVSSVPAITTGSRFVDVSVVTPGGTATLTNGYAYRPVVAGLAPNTDTVLGGTATVITGNGFLGATAVSFGGTSAAFTVVSDTEIDVAHVPPLGTGAKPATVTVTGPGGPGSLANGFVYSPLFASLRPHSGPVSGGNLVKLTGAGFLTATLVQFGGNSATFTIVSDTEIDVAHAPLNPGGPGVVDVTVATPGGAVTLPQSYTYEILPVLSSVAPDAGPLAGGNTVVITGADLSTASGVSFGGVAAISFRVLSNTQISAVVPTGAAAGWVDVAVTNPIGTGTLPGAYLYVADPPTGGLTINLDAAFTSSTAVTLNLSCTAATALAENQVRVSNDNITWTPWQGYPAGDSQAWVLTAGYGVKTVYVQYKDGAGLLSTVYSDSIDYEAPGSAPTIANVVLDAGPLAGGNSVVITGTDFNLAKGVYFNGLSATSYTVNSNTRITAVVPAGLAAGLVDVAVGTLYGTGSLALGYRYVDGPPLGSLAVNGSAAFTSVTAVTLNLACAAATPPSENKARLSNDNITWTPWQPYPAGNSQAWTLAPGHGVKTVYAQYQDGAGLLSTVYSATIDYEAPAALAASCTAWPSVVKVGQMLSVALTVSNTGGVPAALVAPLGLVPSVPAGVAILGSPSGPPLSIPAGGSQTFTWVCQALAKAVEGFSASIHVTDVYGNNLAAVAAPPPVTILSGAVLSASAVNSPASVASGQAYQYQLTITDVGDDTATAVAVSLLLSDGSKAQVLSGPVPAGPVALSPSAAVTFVWQLKAERTGGLSLLGKATGADALDGAPLSAQASASMGIGFDGTSDTMILYPNPVNGDSLSVGLALHGDADEVVVSVHNVAGERLYKGAWTHVTQVDGGVVVHGVSQWAPGVYLVRASAKLAGGGSQSFPVLKVMVKR